MAEDPLARAIDLISRRLVLVPPEAQRPKGIAAGLAIRRYREGLITGDAFYQEMQALGYTLPEINRFWLQALLEYQTDFAMDLFAAVQDGFRKDIITEAEFRAGLRELGMVPERIEGWVFREIFRKMPKPPRPE